MAFLEGKIDLLVYTDATQTAFPTEKLVDISKEFADLTVAEAQPLYLNLAASGSQAVNFNNVGTVEKVYIYSDSTDITVNFNSLGAITYKAATPGLMPIEITSLTVTNASAVSATNVVVILITG